MIKMSTQYRRPLLTFYLAEPPAIAARGKDFSDSSREYAQRDAALVDPLFREVRARQEMVRDEPFVRVTLAPAVRDLPVHLVRRLESQSIDDRPPPLRRRDTHQVDLTWTATARAGAPNTGGAFHRTQSTLPSKERPVP
ncbi:hypothetical protein AMC87_PC00223 (plasmid) [Rhizobium phaseoli]|nr:hypothetical protein AMC87_PC00223 [Rhizobium phaseoli]